jgi:cytosine/adenosine deaminase-related metal-dependent hydrolase
VTTVGNIVTEPFQQSCWGDVHRGYWELRALRRDDVEKCIGKALRFCEEGGDGLSPHAPYTVHGDLLTAAIELAQKHRKPLAMHLAESREEIQLLATSRGPFRDLLEERGWWEPGAIPVGARPLDYLRSLARVERSLVIHGNYLDADEIDFLAARGEGMSVVFCPRTHLFFRHEAYPLRAMLERGVRVALGTDSRASNPDLDLRQEMRQVIDRHGVAPEQALRLGTVAGAAALGLWYERGTIANGRIADLAVVQLPSRKSADPHELLFDPDARVVATISRGRAVFSEHPKLK